MTPPLALSINAILCDAYGHCAELLPELIELDQWGYPIIRLGTAPDHLHEHARHTVRACPRLALQPEPQSVGLPWQTPAR